MRQLKISKQITNRQDVSLDKYLNEISRINMISAEEEVELAVKIRAGDQDALHKLTTANLRFVVSVAKQYQNHGLTLPDLINEGNVGLVKAAGRFDETRGFKFISYAVWWIRQSIIEAISVQSRMVRLPLNKINVINQINKATAYLEQEYQRYPTPSEIADETQISLAEIERCLEVFKGHVSYEASLKDGESFCYLDVLTSSSGKKPDQELIDMSLRHDIDAILHTLSEREAEIIRMFFGLGLPYPLKLEEIATGLDISRERVRQIKEHALRKIKQNGRCNTLSKYLG